MGHGGEVESVKRLAKRQARFGKMALARNRLSPACESGEEAGRGPAFLVRFLRKPATPQRNALTTLPTATTELPKLNLLRPPGNGILSALPAQLRALSVLHEMRPDSLVAKRQQGAEWKWVCENIKLLIRPCDVSMRHT